MERERDGEREKRERECLSERVGGMCVCVRESVRAFETVLECVLYRIYFR